MVRGVWKMYMEISSNVVSQFNRLGWAPQIHDERLEITSGCQNTLIGNFHWKGHFSMSCTSTFRNPLKMRLSFFWNEGCLLSSKRCATAKVLSTKLI